MNNIALAIVAVLSPLLSSVLTSYFQARVKNFADKQDIQELTKLIESAKATFTKETEQLKSQLQLSIGIKSSLLSEERFCIIELNSELFNWLYVLFALDLRDIDMSDNNVIAKYEVKIDDAFARFIKMDSRFNLFIDNTELIGKLENSKTYIVSQMQFPLTHYLSLRTKQNNQMMNSDDLSTRSKEYFLLQTDNHDDYVNFRKSSMDNFSTAKDFVFQFQKACKEYLYNSYSAI